MWNYLNIWLYGQGNYTIMFCFVNYVRYLYIILCIHIFECTKSTYYTKFKIYLYQIRSRHLDTNIDILTTCPQRSRFISCDPLPKCQFLFNDWAKLISPRISDGISEMDVKTFSYELQTHTNLKAAFCFICAFNKLFVYDKIW